MSNPNKFQSILWVIAGLFCVFGGLFFVIQADYMSAAWSTPFYVIGASLLLIFVGGMIYLMTRTPRRK